MKTPKKLIKPEPDNRKELYFELFTHCERSERSDEEYGSWQTSYSTHFKNVSRDKDLLNKWSFEARKVSDDVYNASLIYIIWVEYSDGDTFGYSTGNGQLAYVTTDPEEAIKIEEKILKGELDWIDSPNSICSYPYWNGYFNGIERVHVEFTKVLV